MIGLFDIFFYCLSVCVCVCGYCGSVKCGSVMHLSVPRTKVHNECDVTFEKRDIDWKEEETES